MMGTSIAPSTSGTDSAMMTCKGCQNAEDNNLIDIDIPLPSKPSLLNRAWSGASAGLGLDAALMCVIFAIFSVPISPHSRVQRAGIAETMENGAMH